MYFLRAYVKHVITWWIIDLTRSDWATRQNFKLNPTCEKHDTYITLVRVF